MWKRKVEGETYRSAGPLGQLVAWGGLGMNSAATKRSSSESKKKASTKRQEEESRGNIANGWELLRLVSE
jgi:hypothetical protein